MRRAALLLLVVGPLWVACGTPGGEVDWELVDCTAADVALVERGIAEALLVDEYVSVALADRFSGDLPAYSELLDVLVEVVSDDGIVCGRMPDAADLSWSARLLPESRRILINVESEIWISTREAWAEGQPYGTLTAEQVAVEVQGLDDDGYAELRRRALYYLASPSYAAGILVHEVAHLEAPFCCSHPRDLMDQRPCDYVDTVGWLAAQGVIWQRWVTESQWLDQLYYQARLEDQGRRKRSPP